MRGGMNAASKVGMRLLNAISILSIAVLFLFVLAFAVIYALWFVGARSVMAFIVFAAFALIAIALRAALKWLLERYSASPWT
jgi:hypothetical protein